MEIAKVRFEPMNEVHENEMKVLNNLIDLLEKNEDITNALEEFIADVENHFAFEENLMKKYNFFAYVPHKMEHDKLLHELYELRNKTNQEVKTYIYERFLPWLDNHIQTIDTVTAGFFDMVKAKP